MAVVIDLDALGRPVETEGRGHAFEQAPLRGAFRQAPAKGRLGVRQRGGEKAALGPPLRQAEPHLAPRPKGQRLGDQRLVGDPVAQQDQRRRRMRGVELPQERLQHLGGFEVRGMAWEVGAVAEVLAGPEEEHLDAALPRLAIGGDDVGLAEARDVDVLARLDLRQRLDAVAVNGGFLVREGVARLLHPQG